MKNYLILISLLVIAQIISEKIIRVLAVKELTTNKVVGVVFSLSVRFLSLLSIFLFVNAYFRIFSLRKWHDVWSISEMEFSFRAVLAMVIVREALDILASEMKHWKILLIMTFIVCIIFVISHFWIPAFLIQKGVQCFK